jgi:hypothetical protein
MAEKAQGEREICGLSGAIKPVYGHLVVLENAMLLRPLLFLIGLMGLPLLADDHTPVEFTVVGDAIYAVGEIDGTSLRRFKRVARANPEVRTLVLEYIGGSVDDLANLRFAKYVRRKGFTTIVPAYGLVASGGTDLFLAGAERRLENGACVGVHAWATDDYAADEIAPSDREHRRYLEFYDDMQIDKAFYWYTIDAAPADDMHWMNAGEARAFGLATRPHGPLSGAATCNRR